MERGAGGAPAPLHSPVESRLRPAEPQGARHGAGVARFTPGGAMKSRWPWLLGLALVALIGGLSLGATRIAPSAIWLGLRDGSSEAAPIIRQLRLPRVLLGFLVGGGLAVSGAVLQALVRNPLADPFVLGI